MSLSRASALRSTLRSAPRLRSAAPRAQRWNQAARRGYASHGPVKASSDLPWALGGVVVTVPTCYWLLQNAPDNSHGDHGGHHGDSHGDEEEHEDAQEKEEGEEEKADGTEEKASDEGSSKSDDSEDDSKDTPDTSDDEGDSGEKVLKSSEEGDTNETRKHIPDAKGGNKLRIESGASIKQGESEDGKSGTSADASNMQTSAGKQEGLSNTDTKHSTDIQNSPEKSKKAEGPETAKVKGPVQVDRKAT